MFNCRATYIYFDQWNESKATYINVRRLCKSDNFFSYDYQINPFVKIAKFSLCLRLHSTNDWCIKSRGQT